MSTDAGSASEISPEAWAHAEAGWRAAGAGTSGAGDTLGGGTRTGGAGLAGLPVRVIRSADESPNLDAGADYELVRLLGAGGLGEVWQARQPTLNRGVALKLAKRADDPASPAGQAASARLVGEARVTAALRHPGVVGVYEVARTPDGRAFYVMPENVGALWRHTLAARSVAENLDVLERVAGALVYAHARGLLHRDVKPDNVLLGEHGEMWLGDWGAAVSVAGDGAAPGLAPQTAFAGTPLYMAPEQATGDWQRLGFATDVYLLGAVLFEILTGRPPHAPGSPTDGGDTAAAALRRAARNAIAPAGGSSALLRVARRALASRPEERYAGVEAFLAALREARRPQRAAKLARGAKRAVGTVAKAALFGALILFAMWAMWAVFMERAKPTDLVNTVWLTLKRGVASVWPASPPPSPVPKEERDEARNYADMLTRRAIQPGILVTDGTTSVSTAPQGWRASPEAPDTLRRWEREGDLRRGGFLARLDPAVPDELVLLYLLHDTWEEKARYTRTPEAVLAGMRERSGGRPPARVLYAEVDGAPPIRREDAMTIPATLHLGAAGNYQERRVLFRVRREANGEYRIDPASLDFINRDVPAR